MFCPLSSSSILLIDDDDDLTVLFLLFFPPVFPPLRISFPFIDFPVSVLGVFIVVDEQQSSIEQEDPLSNTSRSNSAALVDGPGWGSTTRDEEDEDGITQRSEEDERDESNGTDDPDGTEEVDDGTGAEVEVEVEEEEVEGVEEEEEDIVGGKRGRD